MGLDGGVKVAGVLEGEISIRGQRDGDG